MNQRIIQRLNQDQVLLPLLLLLALLFRLPHLSFLLPYFEYADERKVVEIALRILQTGDLNPHYFWYGSFPIYWTTLLYGLVLGAGCWVSEGINAAGECIKGFGIHDQGFLLFYLGRVTSVVFGLGTICLTYLLGRKLFGRQTGYLAALFLAISPFHIHFSQVFKVDISQLFWILLVLYFSFRIYETDNLKDYFWGGIFSGLAIATKYNIWILFPVLLSGGIKNNWRGVFPLRFFIYLYVAGMVFLLSCPYALLDFQDFYGQIRSLQHGLKYMIFFRTDPSGFFTQRYVYELLVFFPFLFGPLIYLSACGGFGRMVRSDSARSAIFLIFPMFYFIASGLTTNLLMLQYQLPYLPLVTILGSFGIVSLWQNRGWKKIFGKILFAFSLIFFLSDLFFPYFNGYFKIYREAGAWMNQALAKDKTALTYLGVYSSTQEFGFNNELVVLKASDFSLRTVQDLNPDYVVLVRSEIYGDERFQKTFKSYWEVYNYVAEKKRYCLVRQFKPDKTWERLGGIIYKEIRGFRIMVFSKAEDGSGCPD